MRKVGRHINDRLRAMRFALWAQHMPSHLLTNRQIGGLLDIDASTASRWRKDLLRALSTAEVEGIPPFLTPRPEAPFTVPAAIGTAHTSTRS